MTFSIVAFDRGSGDLGVAVASKFPAVGVVVPSARAGVGAVATQSWANPAYGPDGLELLERGLSAAQVVERLTAADDGRARRQVGVVDARGGVAGFTGDECMPWAGHRLGDGYAAQGNILTGAEVLEAMISAYEATERDLVDRLLAALRAGDAAGGDRRGRQSAALVVVRAGGGYEGYTDRYVDLRVDDHPDAARELARVFEVYDREILIRDDPVLDATPELVSELQRRLIALGGYDGAVTGVLDARTRASIAAFAGERNLEGKLREDERIFGSIVRAVRDETAPVPAD